jgi:hypothetical protein
MKQNLHTDSTTIPTVKDGPDLKYYAISAQYLQCTASLID